MNGGLAASDADPVVVVGGGAVGLAVAEALASRGAGTIVVERDRCGSGASAGNAGWVTPSLAIPVPGPGVIGESLRWLVNPAGPLWIRPSVSPAMLEWIVRFARGCSRSAYRRGLVALQRAGALAGPAFDRLAERGVKFERHDEPLLYAAFEQAELDHLLRVADELAGAGGHALRRLSAADILSLEPALGPSVIGGLIAEGDGRVRPESLTDGLRQALEGGGVAVRQGEAVTALVRDRGGWRVQTSKRSLAAGAVVLAAGVDTVRLLAPLRIRLPIVAAKGYSRTYALDPSGPRRAVYLEGPKVAISAFEGGVRVSGTLELGARGLALSQRRLTAITEGARRAMPNWRMPPEPHDWAGMRSLAPDGLPLIGALPGQPGLHVATAHATLGITLAPATGELLAGLLLDGRPDPLLAAFDPARFARGGSSALGVAARARPRDKMPS